MDSRALEPCPIVDVLSVAGSKWTIEIMRELTLQPTRTRRFLAHIPGLTMKSLRQRLAQFEELGLVLRQQISDKPLKVEYSLTEKGRRFNQLLALAKEISDEWSDIRCNCCLSASGGDGSHCFKRREAREKLRYR